MPLTTEVIAFTDSYKHMECLDGIRLQSFVTDGYFIYPVTFSAMGGQTARPNRLKLPVQRRVPQLVYTNKIGDCLFICLFIFIYLSVRL